MSVTDRHSTRAPEQYVRSSKGLSVGFLFLGDLTYPYIRLSVTITFVYVDHLLRGIYRVPLEKLLVVLVDSIFW